MEKVSKTSERLGANMDTILAIFEEFPPGFVLPKLKSFPFPHTLA